MGDGAAAEFMAFVKVASKLPDPNKILNGTLKTLPENVAKDLSIHFTLANSLNQALSEAKNSKEPKFKEYVDNYLAFIMEFNDEIVMFMVQDMMQKRGVMLNGHNNFTTLVKRFEKLRHLMA